MGGVAGLPATTIDPAAIQRIKAGLDLSDRARLVTFGDRARRNVVDFADRVLAETRNKELGTTGKLLSDILGKAKGLDLASLRDAGLITRLFSSMEARLRRFSEQFEDA